MTRGRGDDEKEEITDYERRVTLFVRRRIPFRTATGQHCHLLHKVTLVMALHLNDHCSERSDDRVH